jgi:hypothetical protein
MWDKVSARPLVTRSIDSIRSSLLMGLLIQRRIAGTREVVAMIGAICAGLACTASTVSPMPLAPIITDPTMKD